MTFWHKYGDLKDRMMDIVDRDLTDEEENALFINHLRRELGLGDLFHKFKLKRHKRMPKPDKGE